MAWEPAFGQDLEWTLLHALGLLGKSGGTSSYFRLSSRPIDQSLANIPKDKASRERRRREVLAGGYRIRDSAERGPKTAVTLVGTGAIMPKVLRVAELLEEEGNIGADVVCATSDDLLFRALQARQGLGDGEHWILEELFPSQRPHPIVTVINGHPHTLSFLGTVQAVPTACLGVANFGQSGALDDLYEHYGIDVDTVIGAALDVMG